MSLQFGPAALSVVPPSTDAVAVTIADTNTPATLTTPVAIDGSGRVSFTVASDGHYVITVNIPGGSVYRRKVLLEADPPQDLSSMGEIRAAIGALQEGGGGGGPVTWTSVTDKPAVIAAGADQPAARAAISAAPTTHTHAAADVTSGTLELARIPLASLDTVGVPKAVFIVNEGTLPVGLDPYTLVIEQA